MDVLIKNMEMPKKGDSLMLYVFPSGTVAYKGFHEEDTHRTKAIELPPHGDLIERTKVHEAVTQAYCLEDVPSIIDQLVPTVLEAST